MPIRRALRAFWQKVTGGAPEERHAPRQPAPSPPRRPHARPAAPEARKPRQTDPPDRLTTGAVTLRLWTVGPYAVLASSPDEAARALETLERGADPEARRAAGSLRAQLAPDPERLPVAV